MSVIMRNDIEVGGTDDSIIAKVGTDALDTVAQDLSGAVNELNSNLVSFLLFKKSDKTLAANATGTFDFGSHTFPAKTGYDRFIIQMWTSQNSIVCTRAGINSESGVVSIHCRNLSNNSVTFSLSAIGIYMPESMYSEA